MTNRGPYVKDAAFWRAETVSSWHGSRPGAASPSLPGDRRAGNPPGAGESAGNSVSTLHALLGIQEGDILSVGHMKPGGDFVGAKNSAKALGMQTWSRDRHWYCGVNVLDPASTSTRGRARDAIRITALVADLDVKSSGMPSEEAAHAVIDDLSTMLGSRPVAWVHSGGGLQPYWAVDEDDQDRVSELRVCLARFGLLVKVVAHTLGGSADSTYDGARLWRVPGSHNLKYTDNPRPVDFHEDTGRPLTLQEITDALDAYGVANIDPAALDTMARPVASEELGWAETTCPYTHAMVAGWKDENERAQRLGRHQWMLAQCVRLEAAHRMGCVTEEAFQDGLKTLTAAFTAYCAEGSNKRKPAPGEVSSSLAWAGELVKRKSEPECWEELGGTSHVHSRGGEDSEEAEAISWEERLVAEVLSAALRSGTIDAETMTGGTADDAETPLEAIARVQETTVREVVLRVLQQAEQQGRNLMPYTRWPMEVWEALSGALLARRQAAHEREIQRLANGRPVISFASDPELLERMQVCLGTDATASMYRRGDTISAVFALGEDGYEEIDHDFHPVGQSVAISALGHTELALHLDTLCLVMRERKKRGMTEYEHVLFPIQVAARLSKGAGHCRGLRVLDGVVHTPVLREDGSILTTPGWDEPTRMIYMPSEGLENIVIPDEPDSGQVAAARGLLLDLIAEFPFVSESDRANYLAMMMAPLLQSSLKHGSTLPLGVINAPMLGSGKTLLAKVLLHIHGGVTRTQMPKDDDELRKQITTVLNRAGGPVVLWDNATNVIRSGDLAALLTTTMWEDRILGESRDVSLPNSKLWIVTGNHVSLGGDIPRRAMWVTIDAGVPSPWLRSGFSIPDLESHVVKHRGRILEALFTLIRAWVVAGRPLYESGRSDTFAGFVDSAGGILAVAGISGNVMHSDTNRTEVGTDDDEWAVFLRAVYKEKGRTTWTAKELVDEMSAAPASGSFSRGENPIVDALPEELAAKWHNTYGPPITKSLGRWLTNREGRWAGGLAVRKEGKNRNNNWKWKVVEA